MIACITVSVACKSQVWNRLKIKFVQLDFWKKFQTRFFKNQVQTDRACNWFWVEFETFFKNQIGLKIKLVQLDFWKKFQTPFLKNQVQIDWARVYLGLESRFGHSKLRIDWNLFRSQSKMIMTNVFFWYHCFFYD